MRFLAAEALVVRSVTAGIAGVVVRERDEIQQVVRLV
jgi:hypothetical protein